MKKNILQECLRFAYEKHNPSHPSWDRKSVHYTFVVQDNKIIEVGMNRPCVSPPLYYGYPAYAFIHSEIDAWKKARGILKDSSWEIVNVRLYKKGPPYMLADAAPCRACSRILRSNGCRRFYFTTSSGHIARLVY